MFNSCQWFWSAQAPKNNPLLQAVKPLLSVVLNHSHTREWTHNLDTCSAILVTGSDLLKHWRTTHSLKVFSHSCQWFWSAHIGEWLTTYMHLVIQISGSDLLRQRRATHFLNFFFNYHVSQIHVHLLQSYRFVLSEKSCQIFNNMHQEMPLTYCQHSISLIFMGFQQDIVLTFFKKTTCQFPSAEVMIIICLT